jgi:signal transduction histidine kinase/ActR/RegA family two-component response regulator
VSDDRQRDERERVERRLAAQYAVARVLADSATLPEAAPNVLQAICESLGWDIGAIWGVDRAAGLLRCLATWQPPGASFRAFEAFTREHTFASGVGLPGRVWAERAPVWIADIDGDDNFPRKPVAARDGLRSAFGFPIRLGQQILGVIEVLSREVRQPDDDVRHMMGTAGSQIGQFIERKRAEEERELLLAREQAARVELEAANRAKDEFLALVSHELRTPLSAMLLWLRMLRTKKLDEAATAAALEKVERSANAQAKLIEDLLDVSRITTGKLRLNMRPVHLASVIGAAIDAVAPAAEAKAIRLERVLDPSVDPVSGDPDRLQQVIWNLLSNAIKFTPSGGRVEVRLERADPHARVSVRDTGIGIEPSLLPHIFDRFWQGEETRAHGGLGLGLSLVRNLIEVHGGTVRAESAGESAGSLFVVNLPIPAVSLTDAPSAPIPLEAGPALNGLRVLVVDDEPDAREVTTAVLEERNADVTAVDSSAAALEAIDHAPPDVIVCDIGLPDEDGYVFIRQLRARPAARGGRVPAAALTAYARPEDRARALLAGFQAHVPKPVEPSELVAVVASLAGWARDTVRTV